MIERPPASGGNRTVRRPELPDRRSEPTRDGWCEGRRQEEPGVLPRPAVVGLPDPAQVAMLPGDQLPPVLAQLAALQAQLAAIEGAVEARLCVDAPRHQDRDDEPPVDIKGAAKVARRSVSWMRKHGRGLPGFVQPTGKGGRVGGSADR
jgi:hypothetical protein